MALTFRQRFNSRMFRSLQTVLRKRGYEVVGGSLMPPDFDPATVELIAKVKPYTLTSPERMAALRQAVQYVVRAGVPGAIVECGVWRGGSMLIIAHTLVELGETDRDL